LAYDSGGSQFLLYFFPGATLTLAGRAGTLVSRTPVGLRLSAVLALCACIIRLRVVAAGIVVLIYRVGSQCILLGGIFAAIAAAVTSTTTTLAGLALASCLMFFFRAGRRAIVIADSFTRLVGKLLAALPAVVTIFALLGAWRTLRPVA